MLEPLDGRVAWITGAGSGVGRATALTLACAGAHVVLSGRREDALAETARAVADGGGKATVEPLDVTDAAAAAAVAARTLAREGRLDVLVNNAGLNVLGRRLAELVPEEWARIVDVNLNGAFNCVAAVLPSMRAAGGGLIVNVSSWAGRFYSYVSGPAYSAAKHGVLALNANINMEEFRHGIRACALCPGEIDTPILDERPIAVEASERAHMLKPDDVAETVLFVARLPAHVCINEILLSPTWNRGYLAYAKGDG